MSVDSLFLGVDEGGRGALLVRDDQSMLSTHFTVLGRYGSAEATIRQNAALQADDKLILGERRVARLRSWFRTGRAQPSKMRSLVIREPETSLSILVRR